jgi:hypothetical protein
MTSSKTSLSKSLQVAFYLCAGWIEHPGHAAAAERRAFGELVRRSQMEVFEQCKEIFHSSFKTRKRGEGGVQPDPRRRGGVPAVPLVMMTWGGDGDPGPTVVEA